MTQNPSNAVMVTGHPNGTVAMWSPNEKEPLVTMLAHPSTVKGVAVDEAGRYLATSGVDRTLRIWDIRTYKCLQTHKLKSIPGSLGFSQRNMLGVIQGNIVEVYSDCRGQPIGEPYLRHRLSSTIRDIDFCNFEDVLGVGHEKGFTSILVPGAAEPNFDAFESNPFMTTSQRKEMEVKALLEKIQPELITLDTVELGRINVDIMNKELDERRKLPFVKIPEIEMTTEEAIKKKKSSKKKTTIKAFKVKRALRDQAVMRRVKETKTGHGSESGPRSENRSKNLLDRFKPKTKA
jgi:U3 small nucleolar RNA-associated protein 7